jgi:hypothetical protein
MKTLSEKSLILIYILAIVLANVSTTVFGPKMSVVNAFLFIGLNITTRDSLHEKWYAKGLFIKMLMLIFIGSTISYMLSSKTFMISLASFVSFLISSLADFMVYHKNIRKSLFFKINSSNILSAFLDSILFPTIAFGKIMPLIIALQFLMKISGGFIWSLILTNGYRKQENILLKVDENR